MEVSRCWRLSLFVTVMTGFLATKFGATIVASSQKDLAQQTGFVIQMCRMKSWDETDAWIKNSSCRQQTNRTVCELTKNCVWEEHPDDFVWLLIHIPGTCAYSLIALLFAMKFPRFNLQPVCFVGLLLFATGLLLLPFATNTAFLVLFETVRMTGSALFQSVAQVCWFKLVSGRGMGANIAGLTSVFGNELGRILVAFLPSLKYTSPTGAVLSMLSALCLCGFGSITLEQLRAIHEHITSAANVTGREGNSDQDTPTPPPPLPTLPAEPSRLEGSELSSEQDALLAPTDSPTPALPTPAVAAPSSFERSEVSPEQDQPDEPRNSPPQALPAGPSNHGQNSPSDTSSLDFCFYLAIAGWQCELVAGKVWGLLNYYYLESTFNTEMFVVYTAVATFFVGVPFGLFCSKKIDGWVKQGKPNTLYLVAQVAIRLSKTMCLVLLLMKMGTNRIIEMVLLCAHEAFGSNFASSYVVGKCAKDQVEKVLGFLNCFLVICAQATSLFFVVFQKHLQKNGALSAMIGGFVATALAFYCIIIVNDVCTFLFRLRKHTAPSDAN